MTPDLLKEKDVIFCSHQWVAFNHPDPGGEQLRALQQVINNLMNGKHMVESNIALNAIYGTLERFTPEMWKERLPEMYVWFDYISIPQPGALINAASDELKQQLDTNGDGVVEQSELVNADVEQQKNSDHRLLSAGDQRVLDLVEQLKAAVDSIPSYVERSAMMWILVPPCKHYDLEETICDFNSWRNRGWVRAHSPLHAAHFELRLARRVASRHTDSLSLSLSLSLSPSLSPSPLSPPHTPLSLPFSLPLSLRLSPSPPHTLSLRPSLSLSFSLSASSLSAPVSNGVYRGEAASGEDMPIMVIKSLVRRPNSSTHATYVSDDPPQTLVLRVSRDIAVLPTAALIGLPAHRTCPDGTPSRLPPPQTFKLCAARGNFTVDADRSAVTAPLPTMLAAKATYSREEKNDWVLSRFITAFSPVFVPREHGGGVQEEEGDGESAVAKMKRRISWRGDEAEAAWFEETGWSLLLVACAMDDEAAVDELLALPEEQKRAELSAKAKGPGRLASHLQESGRTAPPSRPLLPIVLRIWRGYDSADGGDDVCAHVHRDQTARRGGGRQEERRPGAFGRPAMPLSRRHPRWPPR